MTTSALAITPEQTEWTIPQLQALELGDVPTPDLLRYLHVCQQTGLDPFARQILMIGRWDNRKGRQVFSVQTSIDGYRIIAQRTGQYEGQVDTEWCGPDGRWVEVWLDPQPPAAARIGVWRAGFRQPLRAVALWKEYGGTTGMWRSMPALMLGKVAEALALRKAFPQDLSGIYIAEEMDQADREHQAPQNPAPQAQTPQAPQVTVDEILAKLAEATTRDEIATIWRVAGEAKLLDTVLGDQSDQTLGQLIAEQGTAVKILQEKLAAEPVEEVPVAPPVEESQQ